MGVKKPLLGATALMAAFSLSACQPPSAQDVESAVTGLVTRAHKNCPTEQNATLLREIYADVKPSTVTRLDRRGMTVCLNAASPPMTVLPTLAITYNSLGSKTFQLPTQIARNIRDPLLERVADAGHRSPIEFAGDILDNFGSPRQRNATYEQQAAAESVAMRGASDEAIVLHQILQPKP